MPSLKLVALEAMLRDQSSESESEGEAELTPEFWAAFERRRQRVARIKAMADAVGISHRDAMVVAHDISRYRAQGEARMLLKILDHQDIKLTAEQRRAIETCENCGQLELWADRAFDVKTAAELFA